MQWTERYRKAFTLSYDDGVESDLRLLALLDTYGVKCTFNLNSGLGTESCWEYEDFHVQRLDLREQAARYQGHEIAVHGKYHRAPTSLTPEELREEFEDDLAALTDIFGVQPVGMAYAYGDLNDDVVAYLRSLGLRYGRTVWENHDFAVQSDLLRFRPTCHHDDEQLFELLERFLNAPDDEPQIFYLWGHAYELDGKQHWDRLERVLERAAGRDDIFFGTNAEVLL